MKKLIVLAGAVPAFLAVATVTHADVTRIGDNVQAVEQALSDTIVIAQSSPRVTCEVSGTPAEFPNDLKFWNNGSQRIPSGSTLSWTVPSIKRSGSVVLKSHFNPGTMYFADNALGSGVEAGRPCTVRVRIKL